MRSALYCSYQGFGGMKKKKYHKIGFKNKYYLFNIYIKLYLFLLLIRFSRVIYVTNSFYFFNIKYAKRSYDLRST